MNSRWAVFDIHPTDIAPLAQTVIDLWCFDKVIQEIERFFIIEVDHTQTRISLRLGACPFEAFE